MTRFLMALGLGSTLLLTALAAQQERAPLLIVSKRSGNAEIYLLDAQGQARNLTDNGGEDSYPCWSPDGKRIAFASDRGGAMNIYVMDADGGNVKQLTTFDDRSRCPAWSPDGKQILFTRGVDMEGCALFVMDADGGNVKQIGSDDVWNPAWSPDGKQILFTSLREQDGFRIYVMNADGSNVRQLTTNANRFGSVYPSYAPDGKKILWCDGDGDSLELHVADADGSNAKQLTNLGGYTTFPAWSPDGKTIVFQHLPEYESGPVYLIDADGSNRRELIASEELVKGARPAWRPK
jgi:TolB protein